ncbi:MAG: YigZ family protein [Candidatus Cloacimonas sp.]|nr:YigZ family protein [Candidatus Cloacimonadota bacterium]
MFAPAKSATFEEHIRKSRFIGSIEYVSSMDEAKEFISKVSEEHKTATHNCWAYIVGIKGETFHYSDAGEPSGTAGKPIHGAMLKYELTNCALVVTRYFGGTKLGIRGLIDAYSYIAEKTVENTPLQEIKLKDFFEVVTSYQNFDRLKYNLTELNFEILSTEYLKEITLIISSDAKDNGEEYLSSIQSSGMISYKLIKTDLFY